MGNPKRSANTNPKTEEFAPPENGWERDVADKQCCHVRIESVRIGCDPRRALERRCLQISDLRKTK
jgi:hypothetical protein